MGLFGRKRYEDDYDSRPGTSEISNSEFGTGHGNSTDGRAGEGSRFPGRNHNDQHYPNNSHHGYDNTAGVDHPGHYDGGTHRDGTQRSGVLHKDGARSDGLTSTHHHDGSGPLNTNRSGDNLTAIGAGRRDHDHHDGLRSNEYDGHGDRANERGIGRDSRTDVRDHSYDRNDTRGDRHYDDGHRSGTGLFGRRHHDNARQSGTTTTAAHGADRHSSGGIFNKGNRNDGRYADETDGSRQNKRFGGGLFGRGHQRGDRHGARTSVGHDTTVDGHHTGRNSGYHSDGYDEKRRGGFLHGSSGKHDRRLSKRERRAGMGTTGASGVGGMNKRPSFGQWLKAIWLDILTMIILGAIGLGVYFAHPAPSRSFPVYFQDGEIVYPEFGYPLRNEIIPIWAAALLAVLVPIVVIFICQIRVRSFWDVSNGIMGLLYSVITAAVFQVFCKWLIGGLRPHFLAVCKPGVPLAGQQAGTGLREVYYDRSICSGDESQIDDALESFPSGHTTAAFAGFVYLYLYLNAKLKVFSNHHSTLWKLVAIYAPILGAVLIGGALTIDEYHNWYDVVAGAIIGTVMAFSAYRMVYAAIWDYRWNHIPLHRTSAFRHDSVGTWETAMWTRRAGWGGGSTSGGFGRGGRHHGGVEAGTHTGTDIGGRHHDNRHSYDSTHHLGGHTTGGTTGRHTGTDHNDYGRDGVTHRTSGVGGTTGTTTGIGGIRTGTGTDKHLGSDTERGLHTGPGHTHGVQDSSHHNSNTTGTTGTGIGGHHSGITGTHGTGSGTGIGGTHSGITGNHGTGTGTHSGITGNRGTGTGTHGGITGNHGTGTGTHGGLTGNHGTRTGTTGITGNHGGITGNHGTGTGTGITGNHGTGTGTTGLGHSSHHTTGTDTTTHHGYDSDNRGLRGSSNTGIGTTSGTTAVGSDSTTDIGTAHHQHNSPLSSSEGNHRIERRPVGGESTIGSGNTHY